MIGRQVELDAVRGMLHDLHSGPAAMAVTGEAGIGKTTVLQAAAELAADIGYAVLRCRPASTEVQLSYSALTDLLATIPTALLDSLPTPQRLALSAATLRGSAVPTAIEPRAVFAGLLSVLRQLAQLSGVVLAIDDLQWMDEPSRRALVFAVRRCPGPCATLWSQRIEPSEDGLLALLPPDRERALHLRLSGLSLEQVHLVVTTRLGREFSRRSMLRVFATSDGNPLLALEIARQMSDQQGAGVAALPVTIIEGFRNRLKKLPDVSRRALLIASMSASPTVDLLHQLCGGDPVELLEAAEGIGIIEWTAGRLRFTHPLWAEFIYAAAPANERRLWHKRLSAIVQNLEERARHRALAAVGNDPATVRLLDRAADEARHRGAPSAAAELLELAVQMGATEPERRIQAARDHLEADDPLRASALLGGVVTELDAGPVRAEALLLLGEVAYHLEGFGASVPILEQAHREAGDSPKLRVAAALALCLTLSHAGMVRESLVWARQGIDDGLALEDPGATAEVDAVYTLVAFTNGCGLDQALLDSALAHEATDLRSPAFRWPSLNAALLHHWTRDLERARHLFGVVRQRCLDTGAESALWLILARSGESAMWRGDLAEARSLASELAARASMASSEPLAVIALVARAHIGAWCGELDEVHRLSQQVLARALDSGNPIAAADALACLGMAELSVGDAGAAVSHLAPVAEQFAMLGFREPALTPFFGEAVEALIVTGQVDRAEPLVALLEESGRRVGAFWSAGVGARSRGLLLAAAGELDAAAAAFDVAILLLDRSDVRYEQAQALLAAGRLQRRRRERLAAERSFERAIHLFTAVGASQWAVMARNERDRVGLRRGARNELTPTEQRIAELAAAGLTNASVAARLMVSPKTVEANLARIYRKLRISSRAQLGRWLADSASAEPSVDH